MADLWHNIFVFVMALYILILMLMGLLMFEETRLGEYIIDKIIERWSR